MKYDEQTLLPSGRIYEKIERGVMVMKNGKAWGTVPSDWGHSPDGWVAPVHGHLCNPKFVRTPSDILSPHSLSKEECDSGKLVPVERITRVAVTLLD